MIACDSIPTNPLLKYDSQIYIDFDSALATPASYLPSPPLSPQSLQSSSKPVKNKKECQNGEKVVNPTRSASLAKSRYSPPRAKGITVSSRPRIGNSYSVRTSSSSSSSPINLSLSSSSPSSAHTSTLKPKYVKFSENVKVVSTYHPEDYDRSPSEVEPLTRKDVFDMIEFRREMERLSDN